MGILIGMDEAGYGPNFGPLVVAGTAWEVPDEMSGVGCQVSEDGEPAGDRVTSAGGRNGGAVAQLPRQSAIRGHRPRRGPQSEIDLYRVLRNVVAKSASERRIAIADSKALYHPGLGLRQLERGVHAVLGSMKRSPACWSAIVRCCEADPDGHHRRACWPEGFDCRLPVDATADELARLAGRFTRACDAAGVRPVVVRARLVFPGEFNELVGHYGTKGAALSHVTVGLLREVIERLCPPAEVTRSNAGSPSEPPGLSPHLPIYAVCDKHGGRNYYTALLQHHFSEHWIEPVFESRAESRYEWGGPDSRNCVTFRSNGETFLPTALASMTAKYLRELAMRAFNEFWAAHVPDLRPTAGYPTDALRFRQDIAHVQRRLGIDDHMLWRKR